MILECQKILHEQVSNTKIKKVAFLDRDGVVNIDFGYVHSSDKFKLRKGFLQGAAYLINQNYALVIITNQAGIAKSYYSEKDFIKFSHWVFEYLKQMGVSISSTYYCPHHPDYTGECVCRKPRPQMILQALDDYRVSPNDCLFIGDKISDMQAAEAAKIKQSHRLSESDLVGPPCRYSVGNWADFIELSQKIQSD